MNLLNNYRAYGEGSILFWVFTTMDCNCACHYCKVHDLTRPELTLTKDDYKEITYWQQKYAKTRPEWNNVLYMLSGGEPLESYNEWKDFYETCDQRKTVITNLIDIPTGFFDQIKRLHCGITPSCDGFIGKPLKDGTNSSPIVMKNLITLKEMEIPHTIQSVLNDDTTLNDYIAFADWIIDEAGNNHWKTNIDTRINDIELCSKKVNIIKGVIDHLHKRRITIRKKHGIRTPNNFSLDFCGIDPINTKVPGCLCGCGHNLFGLGKTSKGISLFRCNCTNEENMSLGLLSDFSNAVMDYDYGYREKFRKYCKGCPLSFCCGGDCKCGESIRGPNERTFFCDAKVEIYKHLVSKYNRNGMPI